MARVKTLDFNVDIPTNRELRITLPVDFPVGPADVVLRISSMGTPHPTLGDLANSEFFGMWRDRSDIGDSLEFARQLRSDSWKRPA